MNKLDEIFEKQNPQDGKCPEWAKKLTIEFAKHILEEAAENIETVLWQNNEDLELIQNRAKYLIEDIKIRESITSTINKYL